MIRCGRFVKQITGIVVSAALMCTSIPEIPLYADMAADENTGITVYTLRAKGEVSEYGYQDMVWVDEDGNEVEERINQSAAEELAKSSNLTLPVSYSMVEEGLLPAVRDQGKWGTCWAHAAICSLETNMIKKGLEKKETVDYAERHLAYFAHKRNGTLLDGADAYDSEYGWYGGGNYRISMFALAGWYGAANENDYPYSAYETMDDLTESDRSSSVCHLTDANVLSSQEEVKSAIMTKSSVVCSYYSDNVSIDKDNWAVYQTENLGTNHLVSIVGWDDNYKASNFSGSINGDTPSADGAWLCRNSWGEFWGNDGYFWISYEDATLGYFCSFEGESTDNYDHIYQYDGAGYNCYMGYEKSANVFSAVSVEELKAVSFYAVDDYDYIIDIYVEGDKEMGVPSDGELVYSQGGTLTSPGYHTVSLKEGIVLGKGAKYAVSVCFLPKNGEDVYIYAEKGSDYSAEKGQSFIDTGINEWCDTMELNITSDVIKNVCIKAFTDDLGDVSVTMLEPVIAQAEKLTESDYTKTSWSVLKQALEETYIIYESENPKADAVIKAKSKLQSAISSLVIAEVSIGSAEEFELFTQSVSAGMDYREQTVFLDTDIDMTGRTHYAAGDGSHKFQGTFDGGGHSITNMEYTESYSYGGVFGYIGETGIVKNLKLTNTDMKFKSAYSAGIAAVNEGKIERCSIEGSLQFECTTGAVGGIAGINKGTIEQSVVNGKVIFMNQMRSSYYVGGIVGTNSGIIENCIMDGEIISDGNASTGGIVGYSDADSTVRRCRNLAVISGNPTQDTSTAGIGVLLYGTTEECFNYGNITRISQGDTNGAIYSRQKGSISNCWYLDSSSKTGGYSPAFSEGSMTKDEFAKGKAAYYLNSNGGTAENSYIWSQGEEVPVPADDDHKAVVKVTVSQKKDNVCMAALNGITEGEFYVMGGESVSLKEPDELPAGYILSFETSNLISSGQDDGVYLIPDEDVETVVTCKKECIKYQVTFYLNGGNGEESCTYDVETDMKLPVPVKKKSDFLGWYDNAACEGTAITEIEPGNTGAKTFWAKWYYYGLKVTFPQEEGYRIVSCEGYKNTGIQEGESYLFQIEAQEGYDISGAVVKQGENILTPVDGIYRIDHITDDIDITISGVVPVIQEIVPVPSGLSVIKKSKNSIQMRWKKAEGAEGYQIYRKTGSGSYKRYKTINSAKTVTCVNTGVSKNAVFTYKIRAYVTVNGKKVYSEFTSGKSVDMKKYISADELKISTSKVTLKRKKSKTIKVLYPAGRSKSQIKSIKYKTAKSSIAKVNTKGKITAVKRGNTKIIITVRLKNGQTKTLTTKVTVVS